MYPLQTVLASFQSYSCNNRYYYAHMEYYIHNTIERCTYLYYKCVLKVYFIILILCIDYCHIPVVNAARLCQVVLFLYTRLRAVLVRHERCILIALHIRHQYEQTDVLPQFLANLFVIKDMYLNTWVI